MAIPAGLTALAVSACAPSAQLETAAAPFVTPDNARCSGAGVAIDTDFPAGALESCSVDAIGSVTINIAPEDEPPINCSPWFAFRVHTAQPREVSINLTYTECGHRYWPKSSTDGQVWDYLPEARVKVTEFSGRDQAKITVTTGGDPLFISAQEIIVRATYDAWLDGLESHPALTRSLLGKSAEGRDIEVIRLGNSSAREQVILVGRQHPPEVTGALAMVPFVEAVLDDSTLARRFRERFQVTAVPMLNPDGVVRGHWRHNTGGVDLNRDWGKFTQPETRLMGDLLAKIDADPEQQLRLFLDFHSTQRDVVYTLSKDLETNPSGFTDAWLAEFRSRAPDYEVVEEPGYSAGRGVSKNWVYDQYGVPTATFELGDETDRALIKRVSAEAARAMMATLLDTPPE
uniref:M14 family metallopeptidase n=1 Tax=uncultured Altererythrobacter sp. TaxID=500840 RepID=UPI00261DDFCE|nr:M14-type cytosolic carboxypeptidase [uncultured Altererythrobacter sp.]